MAKRTVTAPSGEVWRVRRLWAPRLKGERLWSRVRRRMRGAREATSDLAELPDSGCVGDLLNDLLIVAGIVVVILFLLLIGFPLLLALLDVVVIALLTGLGIVARVLFRRPWVVEATSRDSVRRTWRIAGWRASHEAVEHIADTLAHGHPPPPGYEASPRPGGTPTDH